MKKKAKLLFAFKENGYPFGEYEYRGETYTVCFNCFYCFHTVAEQHAREQEYIDAKLEERAKRAKSEKVTSKEHTESIDEELKEIYALWDSL